MKILINEKLDLKKYNYQNDKEVFFLRIDPEDLTIALQDILQELADFSWLNRFNKDYLKKSFEVNAQKTCETLKSKFFDENSSPVLEEAGEYIVSVFSKRGVVEELKHADVPLSELLGRKRVGNPGFDFFTEEEAKKLVSCGEAKYKKGFNAYNLSLSQINEFINDQKHIGDIAVLTHLVSDASLENLSNQRFGVCAAFSSTNIDTETLIKHICQSESFKDCLKYEFVILVAVNIA